MLKIEQFVKEQFGITLTKHQLEIIAIIAANPEDRLAVQMGGRSAGKTTAIKAAIAYLQDGMKSADGDWWVTNHDTTPENKRVSGPYSTSADAGKARAAIERAKPNTNINYWIEHLPEVSNG